MLLNANGDIVYTENDDTSSSGQVSSTITGTGDNADLGNATITINAGTQADITGDNDTISGSSGSETIGGNLDNDSIIAGNGSDVTLAGGSDNDIIAADASTITGGADSDITVTSNYLDNDISMGAGSTVTENLPLYNQSVVTQYDPNSSFNLVTLNYGGVGGNNGSNALDQATYVYANTDGTNGNAVTYKYGTTDNYNAGMNTDYNYVISTDNSSGQLTQLETYFNSGLSDQYSQTSSIIQTYDPTSSAVTQSVTDLTTGNSIIQLNSPNNSGNTLLEYYNGTNGAGLETQAVTDLAAGGSVIDINPGMVDQDQQEVIDSYSSGNTLIQQQIDNDNANGGGEQLEIINPSNPSQYETVNEYGTINDSGSLTEQTVFNTNANTYSVEQIDPSYNGTPTSNTVFSDYDGTPTDQSSNPYETTTEWGAESGQTGSQVDSYAGFASSSFTSGAPANVAEEVQNFSGFDTGAVNTIFNFNASSIASNGIGSEEDFFTNLPTNIDDISNGDVSTVTETIKDFATANGFAANEIPDDKIFNLSDGDSQQYYLANIGQQGQATSGTDLFNDSTASINEIIKDYITLNGSESGTTPDDKIFDYTDGDSEEFFMSNLGGQDLATSATDLYSGQAGAMIHDIEKGYAGFDGTASGETPTDKIFDFNDGDSQEYFTNDLSAQNLATSATDAQGQSENIDEIVKSYDSLGGATSGTSGLMDKVFDFTNGSSEEYFMNNLAAQNLITSASDLITGATEGISQIIEDFAGADGTIGNSTVDDAVLNLSDGHSMSYIYNDLPSSNVTGEENAYAGLNGTGELSDERLYLNNGNIVDIENTYNGSGTLSYSDNIFFNSSGSEIGYQMYNGSGDLDGGNLGLIYGNYDSDYSSGTSNYSDPSSGIPTDGSDGEISNGNDGQGTTGDGLIGGSTTTTTSGTTGIFSSTVAFGKAANDFTQSLTSLNGKVGNGEIIQQALKVGDSAAAAAAQAAEQEAYLQASGQGSSGAVFESGKWNSNVITWSLADSAGTASSPFSSYMGSQYQSLISQAFQSWAKASGLTFEQVADSSSSDIRIGWGDFDTANTGVAGYTTYQTEAGQMLANTIIRLEDPSQDALIGTTNGGTYAGTQANLFQVMLHEIGHALGLDDNADPSSIMYYMATNSNQALDNTDTTGIQSLYNPANQNIDQLIQAMASLGGNQAGLTAGSTSNSLIYANNLLAMPQHAAAH